jgi:ParB-like chromosome segregation protein Spo0J
MQTIEVALSRLVEAPWNPNRLSAALLVKLERSISRFGTVQNLVARPQSDGSDRFEVLSGNQRLRVYRELGVESVPVVVVDLDDAQARLLAQALNRTHGSDDPKAYAALLEEVLGEVPAAEVAAVLPESEASIDRLLRQYGSERLETAPHLLPPAEPRSRLGEVYELGSHRLLCGDATDPDEVERLLAGESVSLLVTDPPCDLAQRRPG